jgi:hypothetical protein
MNLETRHLELVDSRLDDKVVESWPANVVQWSNDYFGGVPGITEGSNGMGGRPYFSRTVQVVSDAGWRVSVLWGTWTWSSNHDLVAGVEDFTEEPITVECIVLPDDHSEAITVSRGPRFSDTDTIVPNVDGETFTKLLERAGEFFAEQGSEHGRSAVLDLR